MLKLIGKTDRISIGIIAPYTAQRNLLKTLFRNDTGKKCDIEISTIDGFQVSRPDSNLRGLYDEVNGIAVNTYLQPSPVAIIDDSIRYGFLILESFD